MIGRIGFVDAVGDRLPDPFEKAALVRYWDAIGVRATELVRRTTVVQQRPAEFTNNEQFCALRHCFARCSATLADDLEGFGASHAGETAGEGDRVLER